MEAFQTVCQYSSTPIGVTVTPEKANCLALVTFSSIGVQLFRVKSTGNTTLLQTHNLKPGLSYSCAAVVCGEGNTARIVGVQDGRTLVSIPCLGSDRKQEQKSIELGVASHSVYALPNNLVAVAHDSGSVSIYNAVTLELLCLDSTLVGDDVTILSAASHTTRTGRSYVSVVTKTEKKQAQTRKKKKQMNGAAASITHHFHLFALGGSAETPTLTHRGSHDLLHPAELVSSAFDADLNKLALYWGDHTWQVGSISSDELAITCTRHLTGFEAAPLICFPKSGVVAMTGVREDKAVTLFWETQFGTVMDTVEFVDKSQAHQKTMKKKSKKKEKSMNDPFVRVSASAGFLFTARKSQLVAYSLKSLSTPSLLNSLNTMQDTVSFLTEEEASMLTSVSSDTDSLSQATLGISDPVEKSMVEILVNSSPDEFKKAFDKYCAKLNGAAPPKTGKKRKASEMEADNGEPLSHAFVSAVAPRILDNSIFVPVVEYLLKRGLLSLAVCPDLVPRLLQKCNVSLLALCVQHITDLSETALISIVSYCLQDPKKAAKEKRELLLLALAAGHNEMFLKDALGQLPMPDVLALLHFLESVLDIFGNAPDLTLTISAEAKQTSLSLQQVVKWSVLVLDAHYPSLLLQHQADQASSAEGHNSRAQNLLEGLSESTQDGLMLCRQLSSLQGVMEEFSQKNQDARKDHRNAIVGDYSVEVIKF